MAAQSAPVPETSVATARGFATRTFRSSRRTTRVWAGVVGVGLVVFLGAWFAGAFDNRDKWVALVVLPVFCALMLWGAHVGDRETTRGLRLLNGEPRMMSLVSDGPRGGRRSVMLRESGIPVASSRQRRRRNPLFQLPAPTPVFVFGELTPGQCVVCVGPHPRLVAWLRIDGLVG